MKLKHSLVLLSGILSLLCSGINMAATTPKNSNEKNISNMKTNSSKTLVVYFSHAGENYNVGYIEKGNTRIVAEMIADATGADIFEIIPQNPYPADSYNECIEVARKEKMSGARPAIKGNIDLSGYDTIFLGYPNWWGEAPMCVYTFIESHDWSGKKVLPFITHEGSGMGGTDRKIAAACKGADVAVGRGLAIQGKVAQTNHESTLQSVERWLKSLSLD